MYPLTSVLPRSFNGSQLVEDAPTLGPDRPGTGVGEEHVSRDDPRGIGDPGTVRVQNGWNLFLSPEDNVSEETDSSFISLHSTPDRVKGGVEHRLLYEIKTFVVVTSQTNLFGEFSL